MKKWVLCLASLVLMFLLIPNKAYASISYVNPGNGTIDDLPNAIGEADKVQVIWKIEEGDKVKIDGETTNGKAFPVYLKKGYYALYMAFDNPAVNDDETYWIMNGSLFTDSKLQNKADSYAQTAEMRYGFDEGYIGDGTATFYISKAGTYYIGIYSGYSDAAGVECTFSLNTVRTAGSTIKTGRYAFTNKGNGATNTFTFVPTKTGQLKVRPSGAAKISLKNKSGKVISKTTRYTDWTVYFGVKKGVTYKIVVEPVNSSKGRYNILVSNVKKSITGGTSRAKAQTVKKESKKTGVIAAGETTTRWYKITLTKKKKLYFKFTTFGCQKTKFTLYKGKSTKALQLKTVRNYYDTTTYDHISDYYGVSDGKEYDSMTTKTLAAGTYYLRVSRGTSTSSGTYTFSWDYYD